MTDESQTMTVSFNPGGTRGGWTWHEDVRQTFWLDPHNQSFTLNQRAHLLSAELGITPKDALDRLQGKQS